METGTFAAEVPVQYNHIVFIHECVDAQSWKHQMYVKQMLLYLCTIYFKFYQSASNFENSQRHILDSQTF